MWIFIDMNSYFAACEQQKRPELRGIPVGIAPVDAETTCCIAASYEAKACGVKTGTNVAEARRLCPNIKIVQSRPELYRQMHGEIKAAVDMVVPGFKALSIDEMIARTWDNEKNISDYLRTGQCIQDVIRYEVGDWMTCSVGFAPSPFMAKVAGERQKPRGITILTRSDLPHKVFKMKLDDWPGINKGMLRRFASHSVTTTEQMYDLSVREMCSVFGSINGERWYHQIRGEKVEEVRIRKWQVGHSNVLAPELRTPHGSWSVACRLMEKAGERLRSEGHYASRVFAQVTSYKGEGWSRFIRITPTDRTYRFLDALRLIWQDTIRTPSHVSVSLQNIVPVQDCNLELFSDDALDERRIDGVMDKLSRRFGRGTVTTLSALSSKEYLSHSRIPFGAISEFR